MKISATPSYNQNNSKVSFGMNTKSVAGKLLKNIEFNSFNFSTAGLGIVTYGAVLLPRYIKSRDAEERREVLLRDFTTITTILFARRAIQNGISKLYANRTGLVLAIKPKVEGAFKKVFNYLRPDNGVHVLSSGEIAEKYTKVKDCKGGISTLAEFIQGEGGDVKKVLTSEKALAKSLEKAYKSWTPAGEKPEFKDATADDIVNMLKDLKGAKAPNEHINALENFFENADNAIAKRAKSVNANFDFITTLMVVPAVMGYLLPTINEKLSKKSIINKKKIAEQSSEGAISLSA